MSGLNGFWWTGRAHDQSTHEQINARHYPGTRQLCTRCEHPTGRCEEDSIYLDGWEGPVCEDCAEAARQAITPASPALGRDEAEGEVHQAPEQPRKGG